MLLPLRWVVWWTQTLVVCRCALSFSLVWRVLRRGWRLVGVTPAIAFFLYFFQKVWSSSVVTEDWVSHHRVASSCSGSWQSSSSRFAESARSPSNAPPWQPSPLDAFDSRQLPAHVYTFWSLGWIRKLLCCSHSDLLELLPTPWLDWKLSRLSRVWKKKKLVIIPAWRHKIIAQSPQHCGRLESCNLRHLASSRVAHPGNYCSQVDLERVEIVCQRVSEKIHV